jgi:ribosome-binding protein aMBF1 (putative translation factor)
MAKVTHIQRDRPLTPAEAASNRAIREQVAAELPELAARNREHPTGPNSWEDLTNLQQIVEALRAERERQGLSLEDLCTAARLDCRTVQDLERGLEINPLLNVLTRYARALRQELRLLLVNSADAQATLNDSSNAAIHHADKPAVG